MNLQILHFTCLQDLGCFYTHRRHRVRRSLLQPTGLEIIKMNMCLKYIMDMLVKMMPASVVQEPIFFFFFSRCWGKSVSSCLDSSQKNLWQGAPEPSPQWQIKFLFGVYFVFDWTCNNLKKSHLRQPLAFAAGQDL